MRTVWENTKSLLVVFNYEDDDQLKSFRVSLDKLLSTSNVDRLTIIVNIAKEVDKNNLPPHFLIYYNSPNDYSFWGKLKDIQLEEELKKEYDVLLWFGDVERKIYPFVQKVITKLKVGVDQPTSFFDLQLHPDSIEPSEMLNFVVKTLDKINVTV
jgi:hypothetical protein